MTLTSSVGYISLSRNSVSRCPWRLSADSLQRISFTLYRFEKERMEKVMTDSACSWSLMFEEESAKVKEYSLCRVLNRETNVFNSRTNRVTTYVHYKHNMALPVTYLLKYEGMSITSHEKYKAFNRSYIPDEAYCLPCMRSIMRICQSPRSNEYQASANHLSKEISCQVHPTPGEIWRCSHAKVIHQMHLQF